MQNNMFSNDFCYSSDKYDTANDSPFKIVENEPINQIDYIQVTSNSKRNDDNESKDASEALEAEVTDYKVNKRSDNERGGRGHLRKVKSRQNNRISIESKGSRKDQ